MTTHLISRALLIIVLLIPGALYSQAPSWNWALNPSGYAYENTLDISTDLNGDVYILGVYDGDSISFGDTTLHNSWNNRYFIAKYDSLSNFIKVKSYSHNGSSGLFAQGITVDSNFNFYLTGNYSGTVTFAPGYSLPATPPGITNAFIAKFDSSGQVVWVRLEQTAINSWYSQFQRVKTDGLGNVYATGAFTTDSVVLGNYTLYNPNYFEDCFVVKYDSAGTVLWAKRIGGIDVDKINGLAVDPSGNVIVCGNFGDDTLWIDNYPVPSDPISTGNLFVGKFDPAGNVIWVQGTTGGGTKSANSVGTDAVGNIYIAGSFFSSFYLDTVAVPFHNGQNIDAYMAKFDPTGNCLWAVRPDGREHDYGEKIIVHPSGNSVIAGKFFSDTLFFPSGALVNSHWGNSEIFVAAYDPWGTNLWVQQGGDWGNEELGGMTISYNDNMYITGNFDFDSTSFGSIVLTNTSNFFNGDHDLFLARLGPVQFSGVDEVNSPHDSFNVFPNPAADHLMVTCSAVQKQFEVTITDLSGKEVFRKSMQATQRMEINTSHFSNGLYMLQVRTSEFTSWKKVIVSK